MIRRTKEIIIAPTPSEIENEIWEMDTVEQTDLLVAMSRRYKGNYDWLMQLAYLGDDFNNLVDEDDKKRVIEMLEQILIGLRGGNNADSD